MTVNLTLLNKNGEIHNKAGLNWGYSKGNVSLNDAYIPIKMVTLKCHINLFDPISDDNTINVIWDDGTEMICMLEGRQSNTVNGKIYAKQISSYNDKSALGTYLRKRLGIFNRKITLDDLKNYGRTDVAVTKIGDKHYRFDFLRV